MESHPPDSTPVPQPVLQTGWKRLLQWPLVRMLTKFLVVPLIGALFSAMVIGRVANTLIGPKNYYVYIIGDKHDRSVENMLEAAAQEKFTPLADTDVIAETRDDFGDPEQAKTIAEELVNRSDVLMVVGHVYSTVTKRTLPVYMKADPPIPVILTTETNPALLPPQALTDDRVPPVFRLFPTDDNQAQVAAEFVGKQGARSVWVVEDTSNPAYSQYLARAFLNVAYETQPSLKVILWSNNLSLPPYSVDKLGIDWVFFAGEWRNALVLVRQLHAMQGTKNARVLLSDASADKLLLQYGKEDVEGVYLLHPLTAEVFNRDEYAAVGNEASSLTRQLIEAVHERFDELAGEGAPVGYRVRKWLGLRRVSDARRAVARYMAMTVNNQIPFSSPNSPDGTIKIGRDDVSHAVIRKETKFNVWVIKGNKFEQAAR